AGCGGKPSVPPGTVVAVSAAGPEISPEIRLSKDGRCFEVAKLEAPALIHLSQANWTPDEWASLFRVQFILAGTVTEDCANYALGPALTGRYSVQDDVLRFEPQFVPVPGVDYLVKFKAEKLPGYDRSYRNELRIPKPHTPPTVVTAIYPTRNLLPENLLKF